MITEQNFEIYFMDYVEGNLPPALHGEMETFLEIHPEMKELMEDFDSLQIKPEKISFNKKESLKRIAIESDVFTNAQELAALESLEREYHLIPPTHIVFEKKSALYRRKHSYPSFLWMSSGVAAGLALFFFLLPFLRRTEFDKVEPFFVSPLTSLVTQVESRTGKSHITLHIPRQTYLHNRPAVVEAEKSALKEADIPREPLVHFPNNRAQIQLAQHTSQPDIIRRKPSAEMSLTAEALEWKPSLASTYSKNIFSALMQKAPQPE